MSTHFGIFEVKKFNVNFPVVKNIQTIAVVDLIDNDLAFDHFSTDDSFACRAIASNALELLNPERYQGPLVGDGVFVDVDFFVKALELSKKYEGWGHRMSDIEKRNLFELTLLWFINDFDFESSHLFIYVE